MTKTLEASVERTAEALRVKWEARAEVVFALEGERLRGIREVRQDGVALRCPGKLWRPLIATPKGILYSEFRLIGASQEADGAVSIEAEAIGVAGGIMEEQDEYLGDVLHLTNNDEPVIDRLWWRLRPAELELDGRLFRGFSYTYEFHSTDPERRVWRLFDHATWEIGGEVDGNTLLLQGQVNPPVTELGRDCYFTTACNYYGAEMRGNQDAEARVSFQRLPRMGTVQAFDFLAHEEGVLFNYFDPLIEVMSVTQKNVGEDVLHVVDELRRPLSDHLETHPKHILFHAAEQPLTRAEQRNLWRAAYDFVHDRERARHGIALSPVLPRVWAPQIGGEGYCFGANRGPRARAYRYLADEVLPRWADMGAREICLPSLWVSDYTVDRMKCKNDTGMHGELTVSGVCCVRVHEIDELYGGVAAVAHLVKKAHALGMTVQHWWASHLSRRAPIYAEHPEFMLLARDGLPNGGGYGHRIIISMDLANPECLEWEFQKLKAFYEATGIDGLFHDSYGNMTFLPVNHADPLRRGQQEAYASLLARLQKMGMKTLTVEGIGPWGVGHFGMNLLPTGPAQARGYQNALNWWLGQEDMAYRLNMGIGADVWPERAEQAREFSFRCLAGGGRFGFSEKTDGVDLWRDWRRDHNRIHAQFAPLQGKRQLLPDDLGVLWEEPSGVRLFFAFREHHLPVGPDAKPSLIASDGETPAPLSDGCLAAQPWCVYRIE